MVLLVRFDTIPFPVERRVAGDGWPYDRHAANSLSISDVFSKAILRAV